MKMKHFLSSAAIVALSFLAVGCSNDDAVVGTTEGQFTTFVGGMSSAPTTRVQLNENGSVSASTLTELTRTSMDRTNVGEAATFAWEQGDCVWIDGKKSDEVTAKGAEFKFKVEGNFTEASYNVYYTGKSTESTKVTIASAQTASGYNNTEHFGASGDCGVATATKGTDGIYNFNVDHKASYLCFLPYSTDENVRNSYTIKKVAFVSKAEVAGTYTLDATKGLTGTGTSKTVTLNVGSAGLPLTNCSTKDIANSLYMVVAPSSGYFRVDVTLSNGTEEKLISKNFSSVELKPNTVYDIPLKLTFESSTTTVFDYTGEQYYTWDTANTQGKISSLPNVNEMVWYILKGGAMYDDNTLWTKDGQTYTGGIWLKKLDVIATEQNKTRDEMKAAAGPDNTDYRDYSVTTQNRYTIVQGFGFIKGKPTADNLKDYFFLPELSYLDSRTNQLKDPIGRIGSYWSSTPVNMSKANLGGMNDNPCYVMFFDVLSNVIKLQADGRNAWKKPANGSFFK